MSAAVCGSKRSFFDDVASSSPPVSKRFRCSSSSPVRFSPLTPSSSPLDHLRDRFPHINTQLLERVLEECGNDLDSAIKSVHEHRFGVLEENSGPAKESEVKTEEGSLNADGDAAAAASETLSSSNNLPLDGLDWVELLVREMMSATSVDDARARATRVLEALEKSLSSHAAAETAQRFHTEIGMLKGQMEVLIRDNTILKRAVAIQHERQKEYDDRNHEVQHLRQLVSQYQEQLRTLEVNNYALTMHLKQAQQSSSIPGRFHPDVF